MTGAEREVVFAMRRPKLWPWAIAAVLGGILALGAYLSDALNRSITADLTGVFVGGIGCVLIPVSLAFLAGNAIRRAVAARHAPGARLGPVGVDLRVLSDDHFDVHVPWAEVSEVQVRRSPKGTPMLCFDLSDPDGFIDRMDPAIAAPLRHTMGEVGTPIAVNLAVFRSVSIMSAGLAVYEHTDGRLRLH